MEDWGTAMIYMILAVFFYFAKIIGPPLAIVVLSSGMCLIMYKIIKNRVLSVVISLITIGLTIQMITIILPEFTKLGSYRAILLFSIMLTIILDLVILLFYKYKKKHRNEN